MIADQAIDHSSVHPELADLAHADFEFGFQDRADNPAVPNLLDIGLKPLTGSRTARFSPSWDSPFIAEPLDLRTLPRRQSPRWVEEFVLIPSAALIDLATFVHDRGLEPSNGNPLCTEGVVHPDLDPVAAWMPTSPTSHLLSVHRRSIPQSHRLLRTRTSGVDFEIRSRSPGRIP